MVLLLNDLLHEAFLSSVKHTLLLWGGKCFEPAGLYKQ